MPSNDSESSEESSHVLKKKKKEKHKHKDKKHKKKKSKKAKKRKHSHEEKSAKKRKLSADSDPENVPGPSIPGDLVDQAAKSRVPMTKEEWEKSQSVIRRVTDETGRSRLVKGDGEILEEICSKARHREINKQATAADGQYFQSKLMKK